MWWMVQALACDPTALQALAERLQQPDPPHAGAVARQLGTICPRPLGLRRALQTGGEPSADLAAATSQPDGWDAVCEAGMSVLPDGWLSPSPHQRLELYTRCGFDPQVAELHEFGGSTGPPLSALILARQLASVPLDTRRPILRGLLGLTVDLAAGDPLAAPDPLETPVSLPGGSLDAVTAPVDRTPPAFLSRARIIWPANVPWDARCTVRVQVRASGTPGELSWPDCDDDLRPYLVSAIEGSWFEPARVDGEAVLGTLDWSVRTPSDPRVRGSDLPSDVRPPPRPRASPSPDPAAAEL